MRTETKTLVVMILFVLLFINFEPNGACRLLGDEFEEPWMKRGNLLLSSLQRGRPVRPPGNGCCNTGRCGNPCIGSKKVAGRHVSGASSPTPLTPNSTYH
ncbi:hypothetical protein CTI12_AA263260 [Artemisia annua]|uniref:Uncharacterized protein n=1 Tax=Artemisia annua TaxID=35608 RepID=A0A2U1MZV6_ARTAN|nr:hypothetical protein CTI12_AA263260 [Artemisia annua]